MSSVDGEVGLTVAVPAVGALLATVTVATAGSLTRPPGSAADTSTRIASPRSPLPGCERSSVAAVAPLMAVPLRSQR